MTLTFANPDIVTTDTGALFANLPTAGRMAIALDGDGTGSGAAVQVSQGAVPSGATIIYSGPASMTDQVDFSNDDGQTWTYTPLEGDALSQSSVTNVRIKPQGGLAPLSSASISIPYSLK